MKRLRYPFAFLVGLALLGCESSDEVKLCPDDSLKTEPGVCGCDVEDVDSDGDTVMDCVDLCPNDPKKTQAGVCGCGVEDRDSDGDTIMDCIRLCPEGSAKTSPGVCGCDVEDIDSDGDTIMDCVDLCPEDAKKTVPGVCGCGVEDVDSDGDTVMDCIDLCPNDPKKTQAGVCGCGVEDVDSDGDTVMDCIDRCPNDAHKIDPGVCGCGALDSGENIADSDGDGIPNCIDGCPDNPFKTAPGDSTCEDGDSDGDGVDDPLDDCPYNPEIQKLAEGEDCNLRMHTLENGEKVEVFEVWSAHDLLTLRKITEKLAPRIAEGMPCDAYNAMTCEDSGVSKKALVCNRNYFGVLKWEALECSDVCQETDGAVTCEPASCKPSTTNLEAGECCAPETFVNSCSADSKSFKICDNGVILSETCDLGMICDADTLSCVDTGEPKLAIGGKAGNICNTLAYKPTCQDEHTLLTCEKGVVVENACSSSCHTDGSKSVCFVATQNVELRVELMQDIVLSDAFQPMQSFLGLWGINWTSLDLRNMVFDGKGHKIVASHDDSVVMNMPFFGSIVDSTVKNLVLEYDVTGAGFAVLMDAAFHSELNRITYRGDFSHTSSILGEKAQLAYFSPVVLGQSLEQSYFKDIVIDSDLWHMASFFYVSILNIYENIDVNVENYDAVSFDNMLLGYSIYGDFVDGYKFKVKNFDALGIIQPQIALLGGILNSTVNNAAFEIDSMFRGKTVSPVMFSGILGGVNESHLSHITVKFGNIGSQNYSEAYNENMVNPKSFTLFGSIDSRTRFDSLKISADSIMANNFYLIEGSGAGYTGENSILNDLEIDIKEIDISNEFSLIHADQNLKNAKIHYGFINAKMAYPLFKRYGVVENVELTIDRVSATDDLALFAGDSFSTSTSFDYFKAHIGEVYGRSVHGWATSFRGKLDHSSVRIDKLVDIASSLDTSNASALFYMVGDDAKILNSSFYVNRYSMNNENTGILAYSTTLPKTEDENNQYFSNVVVSGNAFKYSSFDEKTLKLAEVVPVNDMRVITRIDNYTSNTGGTLYWLKRTSEAKLNNYFGLSKSVPYYWDKTLDTTPESALDTDAVIKALGEDWSALMLSSENNHTIPWFTGKMPASGENGTHAE